MEHRTFDTNGILLHAVDHGGDGRLVVLAPGLSANARCFDALAAACTPDLRILALDLRGRGRSDAPEDDYTMEAHAADLLGVFDALGLERVVMGGHSFGGLLTYHLAAHHPERIERAVVMDAPARVHAGIMEQIRPSLARLEQTYPSVDGYLEAIRRMPFYDGWWDPRIEAYYRAELEQGEDGSWRPRSRPAHIAAAAEGTLDVDWPALVRTIAAPTLLVRATRPFGPPGSGPILPAEAAASTIDLLPDARLLEVDANHMTMLYAPAVDEVAAAMRAFVAGDRSGT